MSVVTVLIVVCYGVGLGRSQEVDWEGGNVRDTERKNKSAENSTWVLYPGDIEMIISCSSAFMSTVIYPTHR